MTACHAHAPRAPRTRQTTETGTQSAGWSPLSGCRSWEEGGESGGGGRLCNSRPLCCGFVFCGFSYSQSDGVREYYMENSRQKQLASFKLLAVLSRVTESLTVAPSAQGAIRPLVRRPHAVHNLSLSNHLSGQRGLRHLRAV